MIKGVSTRGISFAFVVAVVAALLALLAYGMVGGKEAQGGPIDVRRRPAPDFTLELFDGGQITLSELKGRPVVVNFWASWCKACKEEAPVLEAGWRTYRDRGVMFIGIDFKDTEADALAHIREFGKTYPIGPDPGHVAVDYGLLGIPETFFIDKEGIIVHRHIGAVKEADITSNLEELLR